MALQFDSILDIGKKLRSKNTTALALTRLMLDRIERYNGQLNAFITVTSKLALRQAEQADRDFAQGIDHGLLHGIPIAIKDLIATKDILTTSGSKLFENYVPDEDATVVRLLREAGAVLLGKTGLHELAYGHTCDNQFYGAIANPWCATSHPGGSSGGSAVAVAAGLAYGALGTDTACSLRHPAHCCGVTGFKPSFGLVSKNGVQPLVSSLDHVGPITRSAADAALMMSVLAGYDRADPNSSNLQSPLQFDLPELPIKGMRIGVMRPYFFEGYDNVIDVVDGALEYLVACGAVIVDVAIGDLEKADEAVSVMFAEARELYRDKLLNTPDQFSNLVREKLIAQDDIHSPAYRGAIKWRDKFFQQIQSAMDSVDVLVAPTATISSYNVKQLPDDHGYYSCRNTSIFNYSRQPSISIPCGFADDGAGSAKLPVGMMLGARMFEDSKLLQIARTIEQAGEQAGNWYKTPPAYRD